MTTFKKKIRVAGRAVEYWGSQSISSDISAIFELVKNSRDADANRIEIIFENTPTGSSIIIRDNGNGMTMKDIDEKWLVAGTNSKLKNSVSKGGRRVWGEMGIGRFSCEKLAKRTKMISRSRNSRDEIVMHMDWEEYKDENKTFDMIEHDMHVETKENGSDHGLVLILEDARTEWSRGRILDLVRDLGRYVLPRELSGQDEFELLISAPELGIKDMKVQSAMIKTAPFYMRAEFTGNCLNMKIRDNANSTSREPKSAPFDDKTCGPFVFKLYFYPLDSDGERKWEQYYKKHQASHTDIKNFLTKHSGVYLYRDDVWMQPYGGNYDWLDLDRRRVKRRSRIGRGQVYGIVRISQDNNPEIRPTSNREVLQANQSLDDLKSLLIEAVTRLEDYREEIRTDMPKPAVPPGVMAENNLGQVIKICKSPGNLDGDKKSNIVKYVTTAIQQIAKHNIETTRDNDEKREIRNHELNVMSLGLAASYAAHEAVKPLARMQDTVEALRKTASGKGLLGTAENNTSLFKQLETNVEKLAFFLAFIGEYARLIAISNTEVGTSQVQVRAVWESVRNGFHHLAGSTRFEYVEHPDNLRIRINEADLESILTNLLTNSLESMKRNTPQNMAVGCNVSYQGSELVIKFSDNGSGIPVSDRERIFEPFVTTNRTGDDVVYGQGLGLPVVREILKKYQGTIEIISSEPSWPGATLRIKIPSRTVKKVG